MKWAAGYEPLPGAKCARCRRRSRRPKFLPFCSFHCQEWARLEAAQAYVATLREAHPDGR